MADEPGRATLHRLRELADEWAAVDAWGAGIALSGQEAATALRTIVGEESDADRRLADTLHAEAARLNRGHAMSAEAHRTPSNPTGEVRQCDRRDLHDAHEYQAGFGDYFNVYCPGNDGTKP